MVILQNAVHPAGVPQKATDDSLGYPLIFYLLDLLLVVAVFEG